MKNIILFLLFITISNAQTKITLEKAIEIGLQNNLNIKNQKLNSDYLQKMTKTGIDIPNTGIVSEYGQFNTNINDIKIGVSQNLKFPTIYKRQKQLLAELAKSGQWNEALRTKELTKEIKLLFYEIIFMKAKEKLLLKNDSIYSEFLRKSTLRFDKGETNILEKSAVENQSGQIKIQLQEIQIDILIVQSHFRLLLNSDKDFVPFAENLKIVFDENLVSTEIINFPTIQLLEQEVVSNKAEIALENSKKLPELMGGVFWQTFNSNSAFQDNYTGIFGQIGVAFPLFNSSFKNRKKALETKSQIAANNLTLEKIKLQNQYQNLILEHKKNKNTIQFFETKALKNVDLVAKAANKKFINGDINYIEWVMLMNQNTEIQNAYIEAIKKSNQTIINLIHLSSK